MCGLKHDDFPEQRTYRALPDIKHRTNPRLDVSGHKKKSYRLFLVQKFGQIFHARFPFTKQMYIQMYMLYVYKYFFYTFT